MTSILLPKINVSDRTREILLEIFSGEPNKQSLIDKSILFVLDFVTEKKFAQYTTEIQKNVVRYAGMIESVELLAPIKNILEDLYTNFESAKNDLNKVDRKFIETNIDLISQIIILLAIDGLEVDLIDRANLVKVLSFLHFFSRPGIDMTTNKCLGRCFGLAN